VEDAHRAGESLASLADRLDLRLRTDRLVPLSRWVTPPVETSRRFDTRFFVADAAGGTGFRIDDREVTGHAWMSPEAALDACRGGSIELWPPTATTLRLLGGLADAAEVRRRLAPSGPWRRPRIESVVPGIRRVRTWGAGGIPGRTACGYLVGHRRLVVVDPGDPAEAFADAIRADAAASGAALVAIVLTSADPDALAGVTDLALRNRIPVLAAPAVGRDAWEGAVPLADGGVVEAGDVPLRVVGGPGDGWARLALDVGGAGCVLVGSLFEDPGPPRRARDGGAIGALRE
jgi:hypothetical protein